MGNKVARIKTEISETQMAQAIIEAWRDLFGNNPSKEQVAIILSQNALETGHRKSMWNFNVGNITTDGKGQFDYIDDLRTSEQIKPGVWKQMNLKYRSYPSLKDGVLDYLKILSKKGGRYANAWQNILHPDPVAFSKALKARGYYTADEAPYTKSLKSLFDKFNKSNSYELAQSTKVKPSGQPDLLKKEVAQLPVTNNDLKSILDSYLQLSANMSLKKIYKTALQNNDILIQIKADDYSSSIEFARILCAALDEDLLSTSFSHSDGELVEVECSIPGPSKECFNTVKQMTEAIADAFKDATIKIGGISIKTNCIMNKKSSYQSVSYRTAETNYRKFLLKFI